MKEKRSIDAEGYVVISKDGGPFVRSHKASIREINAWKAEKAGANVKGFKFGKDDNVQKKIENGYVAESTDGGKSWKKIRKATYEDQVAESFKTGEFEKPSTEKPKTLSTPTTKKGGIAEKYKFTAPSIDETDRGDDVVVPGTRKRMMPNITPLESDEYAIAQLDGKKTEQTPFEKSLEYSKTPPVAERKYGAGLETLLGAAQAGYGLQQLMKDKRPVGEIDPTFSRLTDEAVAASGYGFTPEQRAVLNQDIVNTRIAQQAKINQLAGGSAGVGLTNVRAALNDELMNKYKLASEDEQRRMQKVQQAAGLAGQRAGMSRALFADKMNEFMQKQQTGAELLGAGIQNVVGARRYQREREAQDQINKMMYGNSYLG
jgi:hypothetical protein